MRIKLLCVDVDGTLSASTYYSARGEEMKSFNIRDGKGFQLLREAGITPIIMTEEHSKIVRERAKKLGILAFCGVKDKLSALKMICEEHNVGLEEVAYIGDDLNDLEAMKAVGISFCPSDATSKVWVEADKTLSRKGGEGAVREAIDYILRRLK